MKYADFKVFNHKGFDILVCQKDGKVWFDVTGFNYLLGFDHPISHILCDSYADDIDLESFGRGILVSERAVYALILESYEYDRAYDLCIFILSDIFPSFDPNHKIDITTFMEVSIDIPSKIGMEILEAMTWFNFTAINTEYIHEKAREAISSFVVRKCKEGDDFTTPRQDLYNAYLKHVGSNGGGPATISHQFFHSLASEIFASEFNADSYCYRGVQLKGVA